MSAADTNATDPGSSPLRLDPTDAAGAGLRIRLDWRTFVDVENDALIDRQTKASVE